MHANLLQTCVNVPFVSPWECTHMQNIAYLVVTKQDLKFQKIPFMNSGDISSASCACMHVHNVSLADLIVLALWYKARFKISKSIEQ